jgi:hypothetical protein
MARPSEREQRLKYKGPQANLLIVEGVNDFYALGHLCDFHQVINGNFRLEEKGGYEKIRADIDTYLDETGLERIGFVIDADTDITGRWSSLRDVFHSDLCGYTSLPAKPEIGGCVISEPDRPRLGIWLMPDNLEQGTLEHFLWRLIPEDHPHRDYAESCVADLPQPKLTNENWYAKACVHTWLAWREDTPGKPLGQAFTGKDFDAGCETAQGFIAWLRRLFDLPV